MKNFNIWGAHWKIQLLGGGSRKTNIKQGDWLKGGALTVCQFKLGGGGVLVKKEGGDVFEGVVDTLIHTMVAKSFNLYCCKSNFTVL